MTISKSNLFFGFMFLGIFLVLGVSPYKDILPFSAFAQERSIEDFIVEGGFRQEQKVETVWKDRNDSTDFYSNSICLQLADINTEKQWKPRDQWTNEQIELVSIASAASWTGQPGCVGGLVSLFVVSNERIKTKFHSWKRFNWNLQLLDKSTGRLLVMIGNLKPT